MTAQGEGQPPAADLTGPVGAGHTSQPIRLRYAGSDACSGPAFRRRGAAREALLPGVKVNDRQG